MLSVIGEIDEKGAVIFREEEVIHAKDRVINGSTYTGEVDGSVWKGVAQFPAGLGRGTFELKLAQ